MYATYTVMHYFSVINVDLIMLLLLLDYILVAGKNNTHTRRVHLAYYYTVNRKTIHNKEISLLQCFTYIIYHE